MTGSHNIRRNALFSGVEVIVGGLGLFFIYRNVVAELGVAMLGVWSLVLATTAFGRLADVGIAGGLARFVALSLAEEDATQAVLYMRTAFVAVAGIMGVIALLFWAPLSWSLAFALEGSDLALARDLLPWALLSFWALNLKAVLDACLLGVHRADLKSLSNMAGMVLQIGASLALVGPYGLTGLAWAQAGQFGFALILSVIQLYSVAPLRGMGPVQGWFVPRLFRQMLGFGVKLQVGTIANLMFEPLTKIVLGHVGGTTMLGIYEMAYRMVYQVRGIAIMALRAVIPTFVTLLHKDPEALRLFFLKTCRVSALASFGLMGGTVLASPLISWLWLGHVDLTFIQLTGILAVSWAVSVLAAPALYLGIAEGHVTANMIGQISAGIIAPSLAYAMGLGFGGMAGVVGVLAGRLVADLLPSIYNRPGGRWDSAVITRIENLAVVLGVGAISLGVIWISQSVWG
ncbi:lipopolysaccharide biosynthesis protein [Xinfangfangia pollutisoli]|uniref:lipopolysaccharide biosynthesis protein n=1 Tax=Xinfangfangia pollutisoli TaxID=2865960 RepID=UPI001CD1AA41|nr:oligosaccharide flippase family protein [Xinfangfangia pollutisoli]